MGTMAVMGRAGDTKITWNRGNQAEVDAAQSTFEDLVGKGFAAFAVTAGDKRGERVTTFSPDAQSLVLVPPMQGG